MRTDDLLLRHFFGMSHLNVFHNLLLVSKLQFTVSAITASFFSMYYLKGLKKRKVLSLTSRHQLGD